MHVFFTPQAEADLEEIGDYIAADNPTRAVTFIQDIRERCAEIAAMPLAHVARPELGADIRACPHGRYVIFFAIQPADTSVLIVRVLHGARDIPSLFGNQP